MATQAAFQEPAQLAMHPPAFSYPFPEREFKICKRVRWRGGGRGVWYDQLGLSFLAESCFTDVALRVMQPSGSKNAF